jgi:hypothetical protein
MCILDMAVEQFVTVVKPIIGSFPALPNSHPEGFGAARDDNMSRERDGLAHAMRFAAAVR